MKKKIEHMVAYKNYLREGDISFGSRSLKQTIASYKRLLETLAEILDEDISPSLFDKQNCTDIIIKVKGHLPIVTMRSTKEALIHYHAMCQRRDL